MFLKANYTNNINNQACETSAKVHVHVIEMSESEVPEVLEGTNLLYL